MYAAGESARNKKKSLPLLATKIADSAVFLKAHKGINAKELLSGEAVAQGPKVFLKFHETLTIG